MWVSMPIRRALPVAVHQYDTDARCRRVQLKALVDTLNVRFQYRPLELGEAFRELWVQLQHLIHDSLQSGDCHRLHAHLSLSRSSSNDIRDSSSLITTEPTNLSCKP